MAMSGASSGTTSIPSTTVSMSRSAIGISRYRRKASPVLSGRRLFLAEVDLRPCLAATGLTFNDPGPTATFPVAVVESIKAIALDEFVMLGVWSPRDHGLAVVLAARVWARADNRCRSVADEP
jgi:hypothetical protein